MIDKQSAVDFLQSRVKTLRKPSKEDLDEMIQVMIRQREKLEPRVQEYLDEIVPLAKDYKDKAVEEYKNRVLPQIVKHEKVMLTLFYLYTMTSNYRLSEKRQEWRAKVGKIKR